MDDKKNADMPASNKFKSLGKIDLDALYRSSKGMMNPILGGRFMMISMKVSFDHKNPVMFNFDFEPDQGDYSYRYYSLLIGSNGVGKSILLHEIIEFFIDADNGIGTREKNYVNIISIVYEVDDVRYTITREHGTFLYYRDNEIVDRRSICFPLILATTMGMFDKFPLKKKVVKKDEQDRYDVSFYKYVGPKVNSNMYMSKTNLMLQLLSSLNNIRHKRQLTQISRVLDFIGYDTKFTVSYKLKNIDTKQNKVLGGLSNAGLEFLNKLPTGKLQESSLLFKSSTLVEAKIMHMAEICELSQKKLLSSIRCYFYKNKKPVECNNLSSGEFDLLSLVISAVLSIDQSHVLVLLDEPEISQHPNWQRDIIDRFELAFEGLNCHFLIATHSHLMVSNLPIGRSSVIHMEKNKNVVDIKPMEMSTFGWSPEEVLLKVFKMTTDRNLYLAEVVGNFIQEIAKGDIKIEDAVKKVDYLDKVSVNMSDVDPMKEIIGTIVDEFRNNG